LFVCQAEKENLLKILIETDYSNCWTAFSAARLRKIHPYNAPLSLN